MRLCDRDAKVLARLYFTQSARKISTLIQSRIYHQLSTQEAERNWPADIGTIEDLSTKECWDTGKEQREGKARHGLNPGRKLNPGTLEIKRYTADNQLNQFHLAPSHTIEAGLCWNLGWVKEAAILAPAPTPLDTTLALRGHFPSNPCTPTLERVHVTHR